MLANEITVSELKIQTFARQAEQESAQQHKMFICVFIF